jgi:hypothetical protein
MITIKETDTIGQIASLIRSNRTTSVDATLADNATKSTRVLEFTLDRTVTTASELQRNLIGANVTAKAAIPESSASANDGYAAGADIHALLNQVCVIGHERSVRHAMHARWDIVVAARRFRIAPDLELAVHMPVTTAVLRFRIFKIISHARNQTLRRSEGRTLQLLP